MGAVCKHLIKLSLRAELHWQPQRLARQWSSPKRINSTFFRYFCLVSESNQSKSFHGTLLKETICLKRKKMGGGGGVHTHRFRPATHLRLRSDNEILVQDWREKERREKKQGRPGEKRKTLEKEKDQVLLLFTKHQKEQFEEDHNYSGS